MTPYDIIKKKRDGGELSKTEIEYLINGYVKGDVKDYMMSAFAMSVFFRGMTPRETADLTLVMAESGDSADLSVFGNLTCDKHSTGGVGDKTTLIVAPIAASLGCVVAKMSGRALGHTGGTVDKLESIPGYRVAMTPEEFKEQAGKIGICVVGQTGNFAPADKKLYSLRSVTATVESIPLIASSIMSKKLAAGSHSIVLDVKVGSGAFMKNFDEAKALAESMVSIGKMCGRNVVALLTDMDVPLGRAIGNSLEVKEAIEVLCGVQRGALREICVALASRMVALTHGIDTAESIKMVEQSLDSGKAYAKFEEWIRTQGGDLSALPEAKYKYEILAKSDGYITRADSEEIGNASLLLGAGRIEKDDAIDYSAGIILRKTVGDKVDRGEVIAELYTSDSSKLGDAVARFDGAIEYGDECVDIQSRKLILSEVK